MKPCNFPGRKLRRQARALSRIDLVISDDGRRCSVVMNVGHHHEYFVLKGIVPRDYVEEPSDIRVRMGAAKRNAQ